MNLLKYMPFLKDLSKEQDRILKEWLASFKEAVYEHGLDKVLLVPDIFVPFVRYRLNLMFMNSLLETDFKDVTLNKNGT